MLFCNNTFRASKGTTIFQKAKEKATILYSCKDCNQKIRFEAIRKFLKKELMNIL